jgi:hypothetical protein
MEILFSVPSQPRLMAPNRYTVAALGEIIQRFHLGVRNNDGGVGFDRRGVAEACWKAPGAHAL